MSVALPLCARELPWAQLLAQELEVGGPPLLKELRDYAHHYLNDDDDDVEAGVG